MGIVVLTEKQTILRIANVDVQLVPSSNHASPSGALPFLIQPGGVAGMPLTGEKIGRFAGQRAPQANLDDPSPRIDAYAALVAHRIRPAWVRPPLSPLSHFFGWQC